MASSAWVALTHTPSTPKAAGESASTAAVYSYLDRLPATTLARLYASPSSALSIFRLLPLLARHLIMNMLWVESVNNGMLEYWFSRKSEGKRQMDLALQALRRLHIVEQESATDLAVNANFRKSLKRALTGGGSHNSFGIPIDPSSSEMTDVDDVPVDIGTLDQYANQSWETILHFLVGSRFSSKPSDSVLEMLKTSGLMNGTARQLKITSKGFQFLLEDVNSQLWGILLRYLDGAEDRSMDTVEVLAFLFMLGSLELGRAYSTSNLTSTQIMMLKDMQDYGLIYSAKDDEQPEYFYPTRLSTTLTSNAAPLVDTGPKWEGGSAGQGGTAMTSGNNNQEQGFIVLETNYRIYAYTSNPLQIAVLNLFITFKSRFPNLVIGMITRESIKSALSNGITADQIVAYLSTHAHPQMRKQTPLLPPTVVDQIRLWELEKNRMKDEEGYLYEDFRTQADYELVINYARQLGVVLWEGAPEIRKFFVTLEGHMTIREFIKRRMAAAQANQPGGSTPAPAG